MGGVKKLLAAADLIGYVYLESSMLPKLGTTKFVYSTSVALMLPHVFEYSVNTHDFVKFLSPLRVVKNSSVVIGLLNSKELRI